jgi:hypothetical protein
MKEQKQSGDNKAGSKRRPAKAAAENQETLDGALQLQRLIGNQAVSKLLSGEGSRRLIQAELTVGPANDPYEQEADRVAAEVVRAPVLPPAIAQRIGAADELQPKPLVGSITPLVHRAATLEEEEVQAKALVQRADGGFEAGAEFEAGLEAARGGGQPLPSATRAFMEQRIGADFSGVNVHTDGQADRLNQSIQAKAFTTGQDVYFREGAYQPESQAGQELIAHELTHVVQQTGGGQRKALHSEPSRGVFWGSSRAATADAARKSLWGVSSKAKPANPFAKRMTRVDTHFRSKPPADLQRYETSAGFFGNKVTFESSGFTATLAKALDIQQDANGVNISS